MSQKNIIWTSNELKSITEGSWLSDCSKSFSVKNVQLCLDEVSANSLVFMVNSNSWSDKYPDDRFEVIDILKQGATAIITEKKPTDIPADRSVLLVNDSYKALKQVAFAARKRLKAQVFCITGSSGRTIIKNLLTFALTQQAPTFCSRGMNQDEVELDLNLAGTPPESSYAIYDFPIDTKEKILSKTKLARPNVIIVTDIDSKQFTDPPTLSKIDDIRSLVFTGLEPSGVVAINRDTVYFEQLQLAAVANGALKVISFGQSKFADVRLVNFELKKHCSYVEISVFGSPHFYKISEPGNVLVKNSLTMIAGIVAYGGNWQLASLSLANLHPII